MTFQTKLFASATLAAAIALAVAGILIATTMARRNDERIEQTLAAEAKLAAELVAQGAASPEPADSAEARIRAYDAEADRIGALLDARVTLIDHEGHVLGDSAETPAAVALMENHANRPEVVEARDHGLGKSRRHSDTVNIDMLYVAVPVQVVHSDVAFVRVALPLSGIRQQLRNILTATSECTTCTGTAT